MEDFEKLLLGSMNELERFVKFKIRDKYDAEDIIQETCLVAAMKFATLKNRDAFKAWLISIARNKCNDYFRAKAKIIDVELDLLIEPTLSKGICGLVQNSAVGETLDLLGDKHKQILYLYYFKSLSMDNIACRLNIPIGTVKSRLHCAKQKFKEIYPYPPKSKGTIVMNKNIEMMPKIMPKYTIKKSNDVPFSVKWEEIMGWFIVPKEGESISWAMYEFPSRERTEHMYEKVIGKAEVHGIEGVEIEVMECDPMECNSAGGQKQVERHLIAQLTDTHCRILAESHIERGIKRYYTFLDGDAFLDNWGFGDDNCGNEINIKSKGDIVRNDNMITTKDKEFLLDVVGRYTVKIGEKEYDTVCIMDCYTYIDGVASEQFIDHNGKTILWRRFNRDDWAIDKYGKKWTEMLPDNERLMINGNTYVHWYDCITDYIL